MNKLRRLSVKSSTLNLISGQKPTKITRARIAATSCTTHILRPWLHFSSRFHYKLIWINLNRWSFNSSILCSEFPSNLPMVSKMRWWFFKYYEGCFLKFTSFVTRFFPFFRQYYVNLFKLAHVFLLHVK